MATFKINLTNRFPETLNVPVNKSSTWLPDNLAANNRVLRDQNTFVLTGSAAAYYARVYRDLLGLVEDTFDDGDILTSDGLFYIALENGQPVFQEDLT